MFRTNALKELLGRGQIAYGVIHALPSPTAAELIGMAGFDYVLIDGEHGPGDHQSHLQSLQAVAATPATALIRVENNDRTVLKRALDLGVEGVMIPNVSSAEEAREAVAGCRYPPRGARGFAAGMVRASDYGLRIRDYMSNGESELLIAVMIESAAGAKNAAAIAAVDGVDVVQVGPFDLSYDLGVPGRFDDPRYLAAQVAIEDAVLEHGKVLGGAPMAGIGLDYLQDRGYRLVTLGADVMYLSQGLAAALPASRRR
jgi:2-keto-3-deoxy-L-rhamnonate aldolase RhmA